ncbi:MAG: hypothetical protein AMS25_02610 [Gemmatimonas sp. SM23_52]|nr:MAG: hypothetical protein AMS25_02610 [Gemmatimonas sp. SM23_52]
MKMPLILLALATSSVPPRAQEVLPSAGTLQAAHIRIIVEEGYATVVATYRVNRSGEPLALEAMRMPDQVILVHDAFGPGFRLDSRQLVDRQQLVAPAGPVGVMHVRMRYRVEGDFSRIPLFVPNAAAVPESAIRLRILAGSQGAAPQAAFPGFERQPDGSLLAAPAELPSAVLLPTAGGGLAPRNVVLLAVVLLLLAAAVAWAALHVRARRRRRRLT